MEIRKDFHGNFDFYIEYRELCALRDALTEAMEGGTVDETDKDIVDDFINSANKELQDD